MSAGDRNALISATACDVLAAAFARWLCSVRRASVSAFFRFASSSCFCFRIASCSSRPASPRVLASSTALAPLVRGLSASSSFFTSSFSSSSPSSLITYEMSAYDTFALDVITSAAALVTSTQSPM